MFTRLLRRMSEDAIAEALEGNPLPRVVVMTFILPDGHPDCWAEWTRLASEGVVITSDNLGRTIEANKVPVD